MQVLRYFVFTILLLSMSQFLFSQDINTVGLIFNDSEKSFDGLTLFAPMNGKKTYLINNNGEIINEWQSEYVLGFTVSLDSSGNLYRGGQYPNSSVFEPGPGGGGIIQKFDWNNDLLWEYVFSDSTFRHHHDFEVLPNGNILITAWEVKYSEEAYLNGRQLDSLSDDQMWPDFIVEIEPDGIAGGDVVWEWHVWDHLIQDLDPTKENYGVIAENPGLIDINYFTSPKKSWNHFNSIIYDATKDQIIVSAHGFSEFWVIDHSTSTEEAASNIGGNFNKGGDLLYRWGNPLTYKSGTKSDQKLFSQHDVTLIPEGSPNAGKFIIFNNGEFREEQVDFSSVEIVDAGDFQFNGNTYLPLAADYTYVSSPREDFFSLRFSSARELPNGNILICEGRKGNLFEISPVDNSVVWQFISPVSGNFILEQGDEPTGNLVFQALKFDRGFRGFEGKDLTPKGYIEIYSDVLSNAKGEIEHFKIFPNPSQGVLNIKSTEKINLKIYNSKLQLIQTLDIQNDVKNIDISYLPDDLYFLFVNDEFFEKLIKY